MADNGESIHTEMVCQFGDLAHHVRQTPTGRIRTEPVTGTVDANQPDTQTSGRRVVNSEICASTW